MCGDEFGKKIIANLEKTEELFQSSVFVFGVLSSIYDRFLTKFADITMMQRKKNLWCYRYHFKTKMAVTSIIYLLLVIE
ncbi:hypothetical protein [Virgibacillus sp. 6R]|uniref:hypothetical protein n=1 Tax=Metabacillus sp. 22489 TaxID=3453928 RepID=UPI0011A13111